MRGRLRIGFQFWTALLVPILIALALIETGSAAQVTGRACISGQAWSDTDSSGTRDPGEVSGPAVVVELLSASDQVVAAANSWPSGNYQFTDLAAGTYRLRFTPPADTSLTGQNVGTDTSRDSDPSPATRQTNDIVLGIGDLAPSIDVGIINGTFVPLPGIGDRVWEDLNSNGLQDPCEPGIGNVPVQLLGAGGSVIDASATNAEGHYFFSNVASGNYSVRFTLPGLGFFTSQDVGNDELDSDANSSTGETASFPFVVGDRITSIDAGVISSSAVTSTVASTTTTSVQSTLTTATTALFPSPPDPITTAPPPGPAPTITAPPAAPPDLPAESAPPTTAAPQPDGQGDADGAGPDTSVLGPSTSTTTLATLPDLPLTGGPSDSSTPPPPLGPNDREAQLNDLVNSLEPGSLTVGAENCTVTDSERSPIDGLEIDCDNLFLGQQFILTVSLLRDAPLAGDDPPGEVADDNGSTGPQPIETTFLMRVRLTYPNTRVEIAETPGTSVSPPVAEAELEIASGRQSSATFAITPTVGGSTEVNVQIDALSADGQVEQQVGSAKVRLRVAPSPAGPELSGGGSGGTAWWLSLLLLIPLLGAATFTVTKRRGAVLIAPAAVAPLAAAGEHPRVFISYSRDDSARIHRLSDALEAAGIDAWIDSGDIDGGDVWKEKIVSGLQACDLVVLAISRTSVESNNVATEVSIGRSHDKPVLPVHLQPDVELSARMQYDLADVQFVEMFDSRKAALDRVVAEVRRLLDAEDGASG